eukprot:g8018.t1
MEAEAKYNQIQEGLRAIFENFHSLPGRYKECWKNPIYNQMSRGLFSNEVNSRTLFNQTRRQRDRTNLPIMIHGRPKKVHFFIFFLVMSLLIIVINMQES